MLQRHTILKYATRKMSELHIWTDGSCLNNGKDNAMSGIGIFYGANDTRNVSSRLPVDKHTNNRAELCAILYTLCTNLGSQSIVIHTDSRYSIDCIVQYSPRWKKNRWRKSSGDQVEWSEIISSIVELIESRNKKGGSTEFIHVRGHSHDTNNDAADNLARMAAIDGNIDNKIPFLVNVCKMPLGHF